MMTMTNFYVFNTRTANAGLIASTKTMVIIFCQIDEHLGHNELCYDAKVK